MKDQEKGRVWLVGAGPGDIGLFTRKGMEVLSKAQVVVYDSLVGQGVLSQIPKQAHKIYVGKRAANHTMPQEQINQVLLEEAQKGFRVVRLKGGDPFVFGRGGEELELLKENGIPFEIVPGVTSGFAVPAYNGIPVTHRDYCSSLHIITGHRRAGKDYDIDFEALVRTKGTLIFLMGVTSLPDICQGLLDGGMDPGTPAAVLQQGTTSRQRRVVSTVASLPEEAQKHKIKAPSVIVVGEVCALAGQFAWYESLPLAGCKVLVTRPRELSSVMAAKLRSQGAEVLELPAISTRPVEDTSKIGEICSHIEDFSWMVFTSPTGVKVFFNQLQDLSVDIRRLGRMSVAALGEGTAKELRTRGIFPDLMPQVFDGESLGKALAEKASPGEKVFIPRASMGNPRLVEILEEAGLVVEEAATYDTFYETQDLIDLAEEFEKDNIDYAVFTSSSSVRGFSKAAKNLDFSKVRAVCIGKQTQAQADGLGMKTYVADRASIDSVVELVCRLAKGED